MTQFACLSRFPFLGETLRSQAFQSSDIQKLIMDESKSG